MFIYLFYNINTLKLKRLSVITMETQKQKSEDMAAPRNADKGKCLTEGKIDAEKSPLQTQTRKKIIVVDDEESILVYTKRVLDRKHDVVTFNDPKAALAAILEGDYDILIADHRMPGMWGDVLINEAKKAKPSIIAVICSGTFNEKDAEGNKNIAKVLHKPFGIDELNKCVEELG